MQKASWAQKTQYRLSQVWQQLGFVGPLSDKDYQEVKRWLPASALALFRTMSRADQRHCLRVCRRLQERGLYEQDLLAAALLHDVGKGNGRVAFWTRPAIVIGKLYFPNLLRRLALEPSSFGPRSLPAWRKSLSYAWWHAEVGADLAKQAGLSDQAVLYIRTHHQPHGPAAQLYSVDEVS